MCLFEKVKYFVFSESFDKGTLLPVVRVLIGNAYGDFGLYTCSVNKASSTLGNMVMLVIFKELKSWEHVT